jgi:GTP cyclohydrolase I
MKVRNNCSTRVFLKVVVPVTSVCPCSKEISDQGAHNQRGDVTIEAEVTDKKEVWLENLVKAAETAASSEVYSVLKREDEKFVTEKAYQNAVFVEDIVREVDKNLTKLSLENYTITCKNYESIHNHNAFAQIKKGDICI